MQRGTENSVTNLMDEWEFLKTPRLSTKLVNLPRPEVRPNSSNGLLPDRRYQILLDVNLKGGWMWMALVEQKGISTT